MPFDQTSRQRPPRHEAGPDTGSFTDLPPARSGPLTPTETFEPFVPASRDHGRLYGAERGEQLPLPPIDDTDPRVPISTPYQIGHPHPAGQHADPRAAYSNRPDMVIPRIYVEPDEEMDALRRTRDRVACCRDVLLMVALAGWIWYVGIAISQAYA